MWKASAFIVRGSSFLWTRLSWQVYQYEICTNYKILLLGKVSNVCGWKWSDKPNTNFCLFFFFFNLKCKFTDSLQTIQSPTISYLYPCWPSEWFIHQRPPMLYVPKIINNIFNGKYAHAKLKPKKNDKKYEQTNKIDVIICARGHNKTH